MYVALSLPLPDLTEEELEALRAVDTVVMASSSIGMDVIDPSDLSGLPAMGRMDLSLHEASWGELEGDTIALTVALDDPIPDGFVALPEWSGPTGRRVFAGLILAKVLAG
jgi:hypothetical protein